MRNNAIRYRTDTFHGSILENNPLDSPVDRSIAIYLPPGYFESPQCRYPVIYYLHGYDGNHSKLAILPTNDDLKKLAGFLTPDLAAQIKFDNVASYGMLDDMIKSGELKPFILAQPDGSLLIPRVGNTKDIMTGLPSTKGSFYVDSKWTGAYESYIVTDVIRYIDSHYRTIPDALQRAISGVSMGGYGALNIYFRHPDIFAATAAGSPANFTVASLSTKYVQPLMIRLMGRDAAERMGSAGMNDILDTMDLIYSRQHPLLRTVKRDKSGQVVSYDAEAATAWDRYDLNNVINETAKSLKNPRIFIDCDIDDEFGLADAAVKLHNSLLQQGINHKFDLYSDPNASLSPHTLGTGYHIISHLKYCSEVIDNQ